MAGKKSLPIIAVTIGVLIILYISLTNRPVTKEAFLFGTLIRITAYGRGAGSTIDKAFEKMAFIEQAAGTGTVAKINSKAGIEPVEVEEELFSLLQKIFEQTQRTGGYFNPVIGPLTEVWDFGPGGAGRLPERVEIEAVLPLVDPEAVLFNADKKTVYLTKTGMKLDLSGAAKGYAADQAWEILKSSGIRGALINAGESSIRVLGERPGGGPWRIAVAHPRKCEYLGVLELPSGKALGTSADTQHFIIVEGRRYSHLFNPFTGYPPKDLISATIIADKALEADILSTAVFVAEGRNRLELLERWMVEGLVVDSTGRVLKTPGIEEFWQSGSGEP